MESSSSRFPLSQAYKEVINTFVTHCPRGRHSRLLTTVDDSFTGKEAVNFFMETFPINPFSKQELTREKAVKLLDLFLKEGHFHHVGAKKKDVRSFKDNNTIYCFTKVEKKEELVKEEAENVPSPVFQESATSTDDSQDSHSKESTTGTDTYSISYKYDPIPLLNKVDLWNAYKAGFEYRLQELIPYQDLIFNWKIKGQDIQKNCEQDQSSAPFAENIMALMNYLMKLPFSKRNPNAMAAFKCLCDDITLEPVFLTEEESTAILLLFEDLSYSRRLSRKDTEETFVSIVRLFLLTIPPNRRWKLQTLFRVMNKIALDDYSGTSMQMVLEYLSNLVVPRDKINPTQAMFIVQMLVCSFDEIFAIDRELLEIVERIKKNIFKSKELDYSEISRQSSAGSTSPISSSITVPSPERAAISDTSPIPSSIFPTSLEERRIPPKRTVKEDYHFMYEMLDELSQAKEEESLRGAGRQDGQKIRKLLSCVLMDKSFTRY